MGRGTIRRMVEGKYATLDDHRNHGFEVVKDITRGYSQDRYALLGNPRVPDHIAFMVRAHLMRDSVDFDREARLRAVEIEDVASQRMLATEFYAAGSASQDRPEFHLRERHVSP